MNTWQHGRWLNATQLNSPNYCERPQDTCINLIVLHNISLPPFEYENGAVEKLFTNQINEAEHPFFSIIKDLRVSSHFFIPRNGNTMQFVSCDKMAYHAGISSFRQQEKCNNFSIGIEIEGCDFEPYTPTQYKSLKQLLTALCQHYPIRAITGHQHIAPQRKTDPGHFFDWAQLRQSGFPIDLND